MEVGSNDVGQMLCPLPDCGEPMLLTWDVVTTLYWPKEGEEPDDLELANYDWLRWKVECEGGHVLLLPLDEGNDKVAMPDLMKIGRLEPHVMEYDEEPVDEVNVDREAMTAELPPDVIPFDMERARPDDRP